jgi:hypothetical protein
LYKYRESSIFEATLLKSSKYSYNLIDSWDKMSAISSLESICNYNFYSISAILVEKSLLSSRRVFKLKVAADIPQILRVVDVISISKSLDRLQVLRGSLANLARLVSTSQLLSLEVFFVA